jgi:hypothetical protein
VVGVDSALAGGTRELGGQTPVSDRVGALDASLLVPLGSSPDASAGRLAAAGAGSAPSGTPLPPEPARARARRRRLLAWPVLLAVLLLATVLFARPLFEAGKGGGSGSPASPRASALLPGFGATAPADLAGSGASAGGAPGLGLGQAAASGAAAPGTGSPGPTASASGAATPPLAQPSATGRPISAASPARTVVRNPSGGPVTVYYGPTTAGLFGGARGSVADGTPVDVYCGVYAQQVNADGTPSRLWFYTDSGWVPAGYVETGSSAPTGLPACLGTVNSPKLGSGAPSPSTGPFPLTQTTSVLSLVRGVVGSLTNALLGVDPVGRLLGGSFVALRCHQADANNNVWDQLDSGGWVQHVYVYSGTDGSPAPTC